jgi:hypothetical protein
MAMSEGHQIESDSDLARLQEALAPFIGQPFRVAYVL